LLDPAVTNRSTLSPPLPDPRPDPVSFPVLAARQLSNSSLSTLHAVVAAAAAVAAAATCRPPQHRAQRQRVPGVKCAPVEEAGPIDEARAARACDARASPGSRPASAAANAASSPGSTSAAPAYATSGTPPTLCATLAGRRPCLPEWSCQTTRGRSPTRQPRPPRARRARARGRPWAAAQTGRQTGAGDVRSRCGE